MGDQNVSLMKKGQDMDKFIKALLNDVEALKIMLEQNWFEYDQMSIGAEQEIVLVDNDHYKAAKIAMEIIDDLGAPDWLDTELARFNLETNVSPQKFTGSCFSDMEKEIRSYLDKIQEKLDERNGSYILTGILPTLRKFDLSMKNITPKERYYALMEALSSQLFGKPFELKIRGIDEMIVQHDSPLIEACNTSFQVHLQVTQRDFVKMYNIAQVLAGPVIAITANSPLVFGKRLWHETRIALFQQALDTRSSHDDMRKRSPRVSFGNDWLDESILNIFKEDISRYRVLLSAEIEENSLEMVRSGEVPRLKALQVHNSTVYRWSRPCYGISRSGKPHLRIENRVLPAGPTLIDEIANAAFWLGAMEGMADSYEDVRNLMSFADARDNFNKAAKYGIDSKFTWFNDQKINAVDLVKEFLLPIARKGLEIKQVDPVDIDRFLGVIEGRAVNHMNGARWQLRAYTALLELTNADEALTVMAAAMLKNQKNNIPVHLWPLPELSDLDIYIPSRMKVSEFMQTDLFTVQKDDIIEFVVKIMEWRKLNFLLVEDAHGKFTGLVTMGSILRFLTKHIHSGEIRQLKVNDLMRKQTPTISPDKSILEAIQLMQAEHLSCLPVVKDGELRGVITEKEFLHITYRLIKRQETQKQ